jgi:3-hydroxyisobutyrate dehydrogenase-like beta-hydroxyacid dehydrogenase
MSTPDSDTPPHIDRVGLVGYGEVGQAFAQRFLSADIDVAVLTRSPDSLRERLADSPIEVIVSHADLARETDLVASCVWPATAFSVAEQVAPGLADCQPYLDLNSVSPGMTEQIVECVDAAGGTPLKAAIMGSAAAGGDDIRLILGGAGRSLTVDFLTDIGFMVQDAGDDPTHPAALKMFRSMFTKGLRQLAAETLAPAAAYGIHEEVLEDLSGLFDERPVDEWLRTALENTPEHAERRLGELYEVRTTVENPGFRAPTLEESIALHEQLAEVSIGDDGYRGVLDSLDSHLVKRDTGTTTQ